MYIYEITKATLPISNKIVPEIIKKPSYQY